MILESNKHGRCRVERKETYPTTAILPLVGSGVIVFDGDLVNFNAKNLKLFALRGVKCFMCGLEGAFFAKEHFIWRGEDALNKHGCLYTLQLYALRDGEEILFNIDHVLPRSKGGKSGFCNLQPACFDCNSGKKNEAPDPLREFHDLNSPVTTPKGHWPKNRVIEIQVGSTPAAIYDDGN